MPTSIQLISNVSINYNENKKEQLYNCSLNSSLVAPTGIEPVSKV